MTLFRTQSDCDPENPDEHVLWALYCLPQSSGPFVTHPDNYEKWSRHLWDLGFRHHPELQTKKFQLPSRGPWHQYNNAAMWVDKDAPPPEPFVVQDPNEMTLQEQDAIINRLIDLGLVKHGEQSLPMAYVKENNGETLFD